MEKRPFNDEGFALQFFTESDQWISVVGEYYRPGNVKRIARRYRPNAFPYAVLRPDPQHEHDKNAVGIYIEGVHIGYIDRDLAATISPALQALEKSQKTRMACRASIDTDEDPPQIELEFDPSEIPHTPGQSPAEVATETTNRQTACGCVLMIFISLAALGGISTCASTKSRPDRVSLPAPHQDENQTKNRS